MPFRFKIYDNDRPYFITTTIVDWIRIFSLEKPKMIVVDSLKYCQQNKGLEIYAWCLMPSHLHMIVRASEGYELSSTIRDFKTFTSKKIIEHMLDNPEIKHDWMLKRFKTTGLAHSKSNIFKVWQDGYHPIELYTPKFTKQKFD